MIKLNDKIKENLETGNKLLFDIIYAISEKEHKEIIDNKIITFPEMIESGNEIMEECIMNIVAKTNIKFSEVMKIIAIFGSNEMIEILNMILENKEILLKIKNSNQTIGEIFRKVSSENIKSNLLNEKISAHFSAKKC